MGDIIEDLTLDSGFLRPRCSKHGEADGEVTSVTLQSAPHSLS